MSQWLEVSRTISEGADVVRHDVYLEYPDGSTRSLYWESDEALRGSPDTMDGPLCAILMHAMKEHLDISIQGNLTRDIVKNLHEFQMAWVKWVPAYRLAKIRAHELLTTFPAAPHAALSAFSGGLDAHFTLLRHAPNAVHEIPAPSVTGALLVQGFDINTRNDDEFRTVLERGRALQAPLGIATHWIKTNSRELFIQEWEHSHALEIAACLHLFSHKYGTALIGSSEPYEALVIPWGSSPITDHLLGGSIMNFQHDGAGYTRTEKIAYMIDHFPDAVQYFRVCYAGKKQDRNCGQCEKCLRTKLNFMAAGEANPACFSEPLGDGDIEKIHIGNAVHLGELQGIVRYAEANGIEASWLDALKRHVASGVKTTFKMRVKSLLSTVGLLPKIHRFRSRFRV